MEEQFCLRRINIRFIKVSVSRGKFRSFLDSRYWMVIPWSCFEPNAMRWRNLVSLLEDVIDINAYLNWLACSVFLVWKWSWNSVFRPCKIPRICSDFKTTNEESITAHRIGQTALSMGVFCPGLTRTYLSDGSSIRIPSGHLIYMQKMIYSLCFRVWHQHLYFEGLGNLYFTQCLFLQLIWLGYIC